MARLRTILDSVETRHARFVLLAGEDGSGKTRLLQELMTQAGARGFTAVGVTCAEGTTDCPMRFSSRPSRGSLRPSQPRTGRRSKAGYERSEDSLTAPTRVDPIGRPRSSPRRPAPHADVERFARGDPDGRPSLRRPGDHWPS